MSHLSEAGSLVSETELSDEETLGVSTRCTAAASYCRPTLWCVMGAMAILCSTFGYLYGGGGGEVTLGNNENVATPSPGTASTCQIGSKTECKMLTAAEAAYKYGMSDLIGDARCKESLRVSLGWHFVRGFNKSITRWWMPGGKDFDYMGWYTSGNDCIFVFQGSDSKSDFNNNFKVQPTIAYGFPGVHLGIKRELDSLIPEMDFPAMRQRCTGDVTVVGHSLGGGLAQLFSAALNKADDPLKASLKVDYLYTFGAMGVATSALRNDQSADGCFSGEQFWNAEHDADGDLYVDVLGSKICCEGMLPVMSKKTLTFNNTGKQTYPCAIPLPAEKKSVGFKIHLFPEYADFMSCSQ